MYHIPVGIGLIVVGILIWIYLVATRRHHQDPTGEDLVILGLFMLAAFGGVMVLFHGNF